MKMLSTIAKYSRNLLILGALLICGCTTLPEQEKIWPWQYGTGQGEPNTTGDYTAFRAGIANFGEPPKTVKPIKPESIIPHTAEKQTAPTTPAPEAESPAAAREQRAEKATRAKKGGYGFSVYGEKTLLVDNPLLDKGRTAYDIVAANKGNAPVSVAIHLNTSASQNVASDKSLPYAAVVPPHSDRTLLQFSAKNRKQGFNFSYNTSWSIGDYTATHNCPEQYLVPFGEKVRALASVPTTPNDSPFTRYAVVFSVPKKTPVFAARKGVVVQISPNGKVDILHDDATIATYFHLERINEYVAVGRAVTTDDIIGIAGTGGTNTDAFIQLTVWRPEAQAEAGSQQIGFEAVSFPLAFKSTGSSNGKLLTKDQPISRGALGSSKKQAKRR